MKQFQFTEPLLVLDACRRCEVVWFDSGKYEALPEGVVETTDELLLRGREAEATYKLEKLNEQIRRQEGSSGAPPDEEWKWVPAILGLPVKMEGAGLSRWPWVTWSVAAAITIVSIVAFFDLEAAIQHFGLIPQQVWRYGGITSLTSFFLHGGAWHLIGNLYFFLLFGVNVEDYLGRWRFGLLLLLATVAGDALHVLADPHSTVPCIGASGGISGVLVFYTLKFPQARLGFLFRWYWIHLPAWSAFGIWVVLQLWGAYQQISGFSDVSALAHLGGTGAGVVLWLFWRELKPIDDTSLN
jgi:membrane associated rhomboid family serine protease